MTARAAFDAVLAAARDLYDLTPALRQFAPWPKAPVFAERSAVRVPGVPLFTDAPVCLTEETRPYVDAVRAAAPFAEWRRSYTAEQVGQAMMDGYGWFEIAGPRGHFLCDDARVYMGYFGPGLRYPWHWHEAEEIYFVAAGHGLFQTEGQPDEMIGPGGMREHKSNVPHALSTAESGVITMVLWRGSGLAGAPYMPDGAQ